MKTVYSQRSVEKTVSEGRISVRNLTFLKKLGPLTNPMTENRGPADAIPDLLTLKEQNSIRRISQISGVSQTALNCSSLLSFNVTSVAERFIL